MSELFISSAYTPTASQYKIYIPLKGWLPFSLHSRHRLVYIFHLRIFQVILRNILRRLMLESPLSNLIEITTLVSRVEIWIGCRCLLIPPNLSQHTDIGGTHQLLAEGIETMRWKGPCQYHARSIGKRGR